MQEIHVNNEEHALQDSHDNRCSVNSKYYDDIVKLKNSLDASRSSVGSVRI